MTRLDKEALEMAKRTGALTTFGRDLDSLLKQAGISSLREYADTCGVNYKYISQLRTSPERRPGGLYVDLLKPFARLNILDVTESHRLSSRHRGKHLSFTESRELFPELSDEEILESVKQAGEIIDQAGTSLREPKVGEPGSPDIDQVSARRDLLYRNIFVGRQTELSALTDAFDAAVAGKGSLIMIAGEPGIGKTAICEQLSAYIISRGGQTLWGHCYEEGSLSLPYLAFIEAMRFFVLDREADELMNELGSGASDIARIVSEISEKLNIEPREAQNPDEDRYRLMQAVSSFLTNAAAGKPLCVILEDLHDADKGTLEMLSYVSRNVSSTRLLLVGTYRDVEVDRSHPLSAALAELRRISSFRRVLLRGLTIEEVRRMLSRIIQEEISVRLAEIVHRQTEGNPLFVQEVIRYLIEEDLFIKKEDQRLLIEDTTLERSIPEGLRDVIGKRLTLLGNECNHLLSTAAVIGREFRLELLQKVAGITEDEFINSLEEARKAAVVEERSGLGAVVTYRFTHAFFRQTLYEEMIAPRRIRLHQQVARVLEEIYANRLAEHAAELAEHFSHTSDKGDLEKAVRYGQMAARRASDVYAYGEAVRLLEQATKVQEILDPDDKAKKCELLLDLLEAVFRTGDVNRVIDTIAPATFSLAEELKDEARAVSVCVWTLLSVFVRDGNNLDPQITEWGNRANKYAKPDTPERVYADTIIAISKMNSSDLLIQREGQKLLLGAVDIAKKIGDNNALWYAAGSFLSSSAAPQYSSEIIQLAEEIWSSTRTGLMQNILLSAFFWLGNVFLTMGQREKAEEVWNELDEISERTENIIWEIASTGLKLSLLCIDGRFEETLNGVDQLQALGEETGLAATAYTNYAYPMYRTHYYLGSLPVNFESVIATVRPRMPAGNHILANMLAHKGDADEVKEMLSFSVVNRPYIGTDEDMTNIWTDAMNLETALLVGHTQSAELLLNRFRGTGAGTTGYASPMCIFRLMGEAAVLLERYNEAKEHYKEAIRVCTEMRFRPDLALSRLGLAELLLDHYPDEKFEALEHLDFAINEFREMKMRPSLERALRRKDNNSNSNL